MRNTLLLALTVATVAVPVLAEQAPSTPPAGIQLGASRPAQAATPYARLFETQEALKKALQEKSAGLASAPKSKIVCGMTVIEVGPALDPKMAVTPPKDSKTRFTIRAIDPPICKN